MHPLGEFVRKEVYHLTRDWRTLLVLIGLPAIQLILFGYAIRTEVNDADIAILDYSKDNTTQEITSKLLSSNYFRLAAVLNSDKEIEKTFQSGLAKQVIIFEPGFGLKLEKFGKANIQLIIDASNPNIATILNSYTSAIISDYQANLNKQKNTMPNLLTTEVKMMYNPSLRSVYMFVPGLIALILMLVSALLTSIAITKEKEMGNMEILLVSPLKPIYIIVGKVLPYIVLALVIALTVLGMSLLIFDVPFKGNFILFFCEMLLYLSTSLSLGILISTKAKTQQIAMMISMAGLLMPTILLSGFIFPIDNMPVVLQYISYIIPARWFLVIIRSIMLKGLGIEYFWKETLILAGMALFFIIVSIRSFKIRLEG